MTSRWVNRKLQLFSTYLVECIFVPFCYWYSMSNFFGIFIILAGSSSWEIIPFAALESFIANCQADLNALCDMLSVEFLFFIKMKIKYFMKSPLLALSRHALLHLRAFFWQMMIFVTEQTWTILENNSHGIWGQRMYIHKNSSSLNACLIPASTEKIIILHPLMTDLQKWSQRKGKRTRNISRLMLLYITSRVINFLICSSKAFHLNWNSCSFANSSCTVLMKRMFMNGRLKGLIISSSYASLHFILLFFRVVCYSLWLPMLFWWWRLLYLLWGPLLFTFNGKSALSLFSSSCSKTHFGREESPSTAKQIHSPLTDVQKQRSWSIEIRTESKNQSNAFEENLIDQREIGKQVSQISRETRHYFNITYSQSDYSFYCGITRLIIMLDFCLKNLRE